jgi:hypothetical protein
VSAEEDDGPQVSDAMVMAALRWLGGLRVQDLLAVWAGLSAGFRLALAQAWLVSNPEVLADRRAIGGREQVAAELAMDRPTDPLWSRLAGFMHRELMRATAWAFDLELAPGTRSRVIAPNLEALRLFVTEDLAIDENGHRHFAVGQTARALTMLMEHDGANWWIAGVGDGILTPGWPPTYQRLVTTED